jgi:hypothetical protein
MQGMRGGIFDRRAEVFSVNHCRWFDSNIVELVDRFVWNSLPSMHRRYTAWKA